MNDKTLAALQQKHPPSHPDSQMPPPPPDNPRLSYSILEEAIARAIHSFPNDTAGGRWALTQHPKDMIGASADHTRVAIADVRWTPLEPMVSAVGGERGGIHATLQRMTSFADLQPTYVPSWLEPSGLYKSNRKRPDGCSILPWRCSKFLVWNAMCPDTHAPSGISTTARGAGVWLLRQST